MTSLTLTVNGRPVSADVDPRTHLADFLRESLLLTGTHLGCEHGVCGACTLLLNNEPVRACLTYATLCDGADVRTIEGLETDPITTSLRAAFQSEHALQCGYCTPGMLVTARDIVQRLPDADDDRIRLELAGNLCRCTGYNGIVKAIRLVLDSHVAEPTKTPSPTPEMSPIAISKTPPAALPIPPSGTTPAARPGTIPSAAPSPFTTDPNQPGLRHTIRIALPFATVWTAIQNPRLIATCIPGATLTQVDGDRIEGEIQASLGPIQARFTGHARLSFDHDHHRGQIAGQGQERNGGTHLSGEATFAVAPDGPDATLLKLEITYALRGALAQFGRGPVIEAFATEILTHAAKTLEAKLLGHQPPTPPKHLNAGALLLRAIWQTMRSWLKRPAP